MHIKIEDNTVSKTYISIPEMLFFAFWKGNDTINIAYGLEPFTYEEIKPRWDTFIEKDGAALVLECIMHYIKNH